MPALIRLTIAGIFLAFFVTSSEGQAFRSLPASGGSARKRAAAGANATFSKPTAGIGWLRREPRKTLLPPGALAGSAAPSAPTAGWNWFADPATMLPGTGAAAGTAAEGTVAAVAEPAAVEESSLLKGSGVTIAASPQGYWSMPHREFQVAPLDGEESPFRTRLLEVKGSAAGAHGGRDMEEEPKPEEIPTATPVPGKPGFVELSFDSRGLPYIDARGLTPGSEVQIVDPLDAGKTIRFRIPKQEEPSKEAAESSSRLPKR